MIAGWRGRYGMGKGMTPKDTDQILDNVLETGVPREVLQGSRSPLRLEDLPRREALNCTPEELVETSWRWEP
jgi:hypothetical protein